MFLADVTCGNLSNLRVDQIIPQLTSTAVTIIQIAVPLLLIFFGMLDLGKAVIAQKEDEIKKGQQIFIKRLITAAVVFLVVFIVKTVIGFVATDNASITDCINCFISGPDKCTVVQ